MRLAAVLFLLMGSASAGGAKDAIQPFSGPLRFCGLNMMIDLQMGERLSYRAGPDFGIYEVRSAQGSFSVYEGFAPDTSAARRTEVTLPDGRKAIKLAGINRVSYLFKVGSEYVHVFGPDLTGNDADGPRLARVRTGRGNATGCAKPSFNRWASIEAQMDATRPN